MGGKAITAICLDPGYLFISGSLYSGQYLHLWSATVRCSGLKANLVSKHTANPFPVLKFRFQPSCAGKNVVISYMTSFTAQRQPFSSYHDVIIQCKWKNDVDKLKNFCNSTVITFKTLSIVKVFFFPLPHCKIRAIHLIY